MRPGVTRAPAIFVLASILASFLLVIAPITASAAESIPELQWPAVKSSKYIWETITSPSGVTDACVDGYGNDYDSNLKTISNSGQIVRELNRSETIDGRPNCIRHPVVDRNNHLYGIHDSKSLLAYRGNTLKWKYATQCNVTPVVGANGNIYTLSSESNGIRLIGLTPDVESGTSLPKKVLDVPYNTCRGELVALKDGLAIQSDTTLFYSYSGRSLGGPGNIFIERPEQINAMGRVFYPTYTGSGDTVSIKVSAYDAFRKKLAWTTPEAVFGQGIVQSKIYSEPKGGAIVLVRRTKVSGGVPTTEKVYALIKLNVLGQKIWEKELPNQDVSANQFGSPRIVIDTNGKIVVTRDGELKTNNSYNPTMPGISIGVFDANGHVTYDKIMRGNLDQTSGGVSGYRTGGQGTNGSTTGLNTLYLLGVCKGTCPSFDETKLYPLKIPGLGLDYPRGAVITRTPRTTAAYIAEGDSFSAGEGNPTFEAGTDIENVNKCHRSSAAYPRLIAGSSPKIPPLGSSGFRACSGAVSENIWDVPQWNEGTQLDLWPDTTTKLVTLTIGGNDIGFGDFASECFWHTCDTGTVYNATLNKINNELPGKLLATYRKTLQYAPNARIYVVGYPQVVGYKSPTDPDDIRCFYLQGGSTKWSEARATREVVTKLNEKISAAVDIVRNEHPNNLRLSFIAIDKPGSPFIGHEVCGTNSISWFHNVDQAKNDPAYVFHPNTDGHEGLAAIIATAINAA